MANQAPLVSIAMPFYNCEATLFAALESIRQQTCDEWELLLCDDGSTDGSLACAARFGDPRVILWSDGRRKGLAERLNECIDRARGSYIARMDADDITYPDRLRRQLEFLENHPDVDLVGSHMLVFGDDGTAFGKRVVPAQHQEIVANPALSFGIGHPTWMGRTRWYQRYRYNAKAIRYEDVELLYRSFRDSRFANIPEVLHGYRVSPGGLGKRLKTRLGRVRFLWKSGNLGACEATLVEPLKAVCDALFVGIGLHHVMLRSREHSLTAEEVQRWQAVFRQTCVAELSGAV